jgi:hypothetical protein
MAAMGYRIRFFRIAERRVNGCFEDGAKFPPLGLEAGDLTAGEPRLAVGNRS